MCARKHECAQYLCGSLLQQSKVVSVASTRLYSQRLPVQQLRGAMPPSRLTVLKRAAKKLWTKKPEAKQKRKRAQTALETISQGEKELKEELEKALAAYWEEKDRVGRIQESPDMPMLSDSEEDVEKRNFCG